MSYSSLKKSYKDELFEYFDIYEFRGGGGGGGGGHGGGGHGGMGGGVRVGGGGYDGRGGYGRGWNAGWGYGSGYGWGPGWGYGVYDPMIYYTDNCFCQDEDKLKNDYKICVDKDTCGICLPCGDCNNKNYQYKKYCN